MDIKGTTRDDVNPTHIVIAMVVDNPLWEAFLNSEEVTEHLTAKLDGVVWMVAARFDQLEELLQQFQQGIGSRIMRRLAWAASHYPHLVLCQDVTLEAFSESARVYEADTLILGARNVETLFGRGR